MELKNALRSLHLREEVNKFMNYVVISFTGWFSLNRLIEFKFFSFHSNSEV